MLRIHVVREGGHHYYVNDLVPGRAEGTLVAGEEPGIWSGSGSAALGLRGTVDSEVFADVLDGRDPLSGRALRVRRGGSSVAGYDLTFAAPKSVSLLHLLAPGELAGEVGSGHQAAVSEATEYLGRSAVGVRRTRDRQVALLSSTGAVAGQFLHRTSRTLDPHLHTHVVVANVAEGVDGVWSAVDSRRVFAHVRAAQGIYHARLRLELSIRVGAGWSVSGSGLGDVIGVDGSLRRLFSQRSAAMDEYQHGRVGPSPGPARSQGAFHATRPDKDRTRTVESLAAEWKERAADFGFDLGDLTRVIGCKRGVQAGAEVDPERVRVRLGQLARDNRTIARRDLVAVVAAASTAGASAGVIESVAARIAEASGPPIGTGRADRHRGDAGGETRGVRSAEPRWMAGAVARTVARRPEEILVSPLLREGVADRSVATPGRPPALDRARPDGFALRHVREASHQLGR